MPQAPLLRPREVVRAFESLGWQACGSKAVTSF